MVIVNSKHETCPPAPKAPITIKLENSSFILEESTSALRVTGACAQQAPQGSHQRLHSHFSRVFKPVLISEERRGCFNTLSATLVCQVPHDKHALTRDYRDACARESMKSVSFAVPLIFSGGKRDNGVALITLFCACPFVLPHFGYFSLILLTSFSLSTRIAKKVGNPFSITSPVSWLYVLIGASYSTGSDIGGANRCLSER